MIVLLMTAGIAAGGLTSLAPDIFLARSYLVAMLLPSIVRQPCWEALRVILRR